MADGGVIVTVVGADQVARGLNLLPARLLGAQQKGGKQIGREALRRWRRVTANWHHQPEFEVEVNVSPDGVEVLSGSDDQILGFVSGGTSVRRAVMSADWQSKTRPGSMTSGPGSGRVVFIGSNIVRPGIEPRRFDEQIAKEMDPLAVEIMQKHVDREVAKKFV